MNQPLQKNESTIPKILKQLSSLSGHQKMLREIEGTRFFSELKDYATQVKDGLFPNEESRALDRESEELARLDRLAHLKLDHADWQNIQKTNFRVVGKKIESLVQPALAFYNNAQQRDGVLFDSVEKRLKGDRAIQKNRPACLLVAGGFHTEGVTRLLRKKNISYAVLMPQIDKLPDESVYQNQMRGLVSWGKYLKVENGSIDLNAAFIRATRDRLLGSSLESSVLSREQKQSNSPSPTPQDPRLLKNWRDQIIRDLSSQGRITEAAQYTRYLDEVTVSNNTTENEFIRAWRANIHRFVDDLKRLDGQKQLTPENVSNLLTPSVLSPAFPANAIAVGTFFTAGLTLRNGVFRPNAAPNVSSYMPRKQPPQPATEQPQKIRSEMRAAILNLPEFEAKDYAVSFNTANAGTRIQAILSYPGNASNIEQLQLGDTRVSIQLDQGVLSGGITPRKFKALIEKVYEFLTPEQKDQFRDRLVSAGKPVAIGRIERSNDQWQSRKIIEFVLAQGQDPAYVSINDYFFQEIPDDNLAAVQLATALLELSADEADGLYRKLAPSLDFSQELAAWHFEIEDRHYNISGQVADVFIEANRERYRFISDSNEEFSGVYSEIQKITEKILIAAGYDPAHFNLHLADYREGNAYVISFANHIVLNLGLIWKMVDAVMAEGSSPDTLDEFQKEFIAFVLAHEISHIKQSRDAINWGEIPKEETLEDLHKKMNQTHMEMIGEKYAEHAEAYAEEIDADSHAIDLMDAAGFNVRIAHRSFELMALMDGLDESKKKRRWDENFFRKVMRQIDEHPLMGERIRNIKRKVRSIFAKNEYAEPVAFDRSFFEEMMEWDTDGAYHFRRTRMRDYHLRVASVKTLADWQAVLKDAKTGKEYEMAMSIGLYALFAEYADQIFIDSKNPQHRKILEQWQATLRKVQVHGKETRVAVGKKINKDLESDRYDLQMQYGWGSYGWDTGDLPFDHTMYISESSLKQERDTKKDYRRKLFRDFLLARILGGSHLKFDVGLLEMGYLDSTQEEKIKDLREEFHDRANLEWKLFAKEVNPIFDMLSSSSEILDMIPIIQHAAREQLRDMSALGPQDLAGAISHYYNLRAIQNMYGEGQILPEEISSFDQSPQGLKAKMQQASKDELVGLGQALLASQWTPDFYETEIEDKGIFNDIADPSVGFSERTVFLGGLSVEVLRAYEATILKRKDEFDLEELLVIFDQVLNLKQFIQTKYKGHWDWDHNAIHSVGLHLSTEILIRLKAQPETMTDQLLSRLFKLWEAHPSLLTVPKNDSHSFEHQITGNFLFEHFILDSRNYERYRTRIQHLIAKNQDRIIVVNFSDDARKALDEKSSQGISDYVPGGMPLVEFMLEALLEGRLNGQEFFSPQGIHAGRPELVFLEFFRLANGFLYSSEPTWRPLEGREMLRQKTLRTVEDSFGIKTSAAKIRFYEAILKATEGFDDIPLNAKSVEIRPEEFSFSTQKSTHFLPLTYFLFEQIQMQSEGNVSLWELRQAFQAIPNSRSSSKETLGEATADDLEHFIMSTNTFVRVLGAHYLYQFNPDLSVEVLDQNLKYLWERQQAALAERGTLEAAIHAQVRARAVSLGVGFFQEPHPDLELLMHQFASGAVTSLETFNEIVIEGVKSKGWNIDELKILYQFLAALLPEQNKRKFNTQTPGEVKNFGQYLVSLSLLIAQKEFDFEIKDGSFFAPGNGKTKEGNPYLIIGDELQLDDDGFKHEHMRKRSDAAVRNSARRSTDRFHFLNVPVESLRQIFGFVDQRPEWGVDEWVQYARDFMPPSVMRNLFLYHVFWQNGIKGHPALKHVKEGQFYDWSFLMNQLSRLDSQSPEDQQLLQTAREIAPLLTYDESMAAFNAQGVQELMKSFAISQKQIEDDNSLKNGAHFVGLILGRIIYETFFALILLLLKIAPSIPAKARRWFLKGLIWLISNFTEWLNVNELSKGLFLSVLAASHKAPRAMARGIQVFLAAKRLDWYGEIRNYRPVREVLRLSLSFLAVISKTRRVSWEFNEPGNIDSQIDLAIVYPYRQQMLRTASDVSITAEDRLVEINSLFHRPSPVRDEFLNALMESVLKDERRNEQQKLSTLKRIYPQLYQSFFKERYALKALDMDMTLRGAVSFRDELDLITKEYFPDYSFTRDDLLLEVMERANVPPENIEVRSYLLQVQENVTKEKVRQKVFAENKIRETIQKSGNQDKKEFALWIMGLRTSKPFLVVEIEYLYGVKLDYLRELMNQPPSEHYKTSGQSLKRDMMESLFGGQDGILKDKKVFKQFLNTVFKKAVGRNIRNRGQLKTVLRIVFDKVNNEKKLDLISGIATQMRPGQPIDTGAVVRAFFESYGLIGIKAGQILSHSDVKLDESVRHALEGLSSSADPYGKKSIFQILSLVLGENFAEHFQEVRQRLGSASIKVVYDLLLADGGEAVMKLKRPQIDKLLDEELAVFESILDALTAAGLNIPTGLGKQIAKAIREEVNFEIERFNREKFRKMLGADTAHYSIKTAGQSRNVTFTTAHSRLDLDQLFPEALHNAVMFEEKVKDGVALNDPKIETKLGLTPEEMDQLKKLIFEHLLKQMFTDGFFHADPHGGNILVRKNIKTGNLELVFIDLGSMGRNGIEVNAQDVSQSVPGVEPTMLTVDGKAFQIVDPAASGENRVALNPALAPEDFDRASESYAEQLKPLWEQGRQAQQQRMRQLAQWLMYMGLHQGKTPSIPNDKILEALFFNKVPYLIRTVSGDPFYIAKEIFPRLGLEFPTDHPAADQLQAVIMASKGAWSRLEKKDYQKNWRDRVQILTVGLRKIISPSKSTRSEMRHNRGSEMRVTLKKRFGVFLQRGLYRFSHYGSPVVGVFSIGYGALGLMQQFEFFSRVSAIANGSSMPLSLYSLIVGHAVFSMGAIALGLYLLVRRGGFYKKTFGPHGILRLKKEGIIEGKETLSAHIFNPADRPTVGIIQDLQVAFSQLKEHFRRTSKGEIPQISFTVYTEKTRQLVLALLTREFKQLHELKRGEPLNTNLEKQLQDGLKPVEDLRSARTQWVERMEFNLLRRLEILAPGDTVLKQSVTYVYNIPSDQVTAAALARRSEMRAVGAINGLSVDEKRLILATDFFIQDGAVPVKLLEQQSTSLTVSPEQVLRYLEKFYGSDGQFLTDDDFRKARYAAVQDTSWNHAEIRRIAQSVRRQREDLKVDALEILGTRVLQSLKKINAAEGGVGAVAEHLALRTTLEVIVEMSARNAAAFSAEQQARVERERSALEIVVALLSDVTEASIRRKHKIYLGLVGRHGAISELDDLVASIFKQWNEPVQQVAPPRTSPEKRVAKKKLFSEESARQALWQDFYHGMGGYRAGGFMDIAYSMMGGRHPFDSKRFLVGGHDIGKAAQSVVEQLMPLTLLNRLIAETQKKVGPLKAGSGGESNLSGQEYNPWKNEIGIGEYPIVFPHEVGHLIFSRWLIGKDELTREKRDQFWRGHFGKPDQNRPLQDSENPVLVREYAALVGAETPQALSLEPLDWNNSLNENFAHNIERLVYGQPFIVAPKARRTSTDTLLIFFIKIGVINAAEADFYRLLSFRLNGKKPVTPIVQRTSNHTQPEMAYFAASEKRLLQREAEGKLSLAGEVAARLGEEAGDESVVVGQWIRENPAGVATLLEQMHGATGEDSIMEKLLAPNEQVAETKTIQYEDITLGVHLPVSITRSGREVTIRVSAKPGDPNPSIATRTVIPGQPVYVKIGRAESNDIIIKDPYVSGNHLKIRITEDGISVRDRSSNNGVYLGGLRVGQDGAYYPIPEARSEMRSDLAPNGQALSLVSQPETTEERTLLETLRQITYSTNFAGARADGIAFEGEGINTRTYSVQSFPHLVFKVYRRPLQSDSKGYTKDLKHLEQITEQRLEGSHTVDVDGFRLVKIAGGIPAFRFVALDDDEAPSFIISEKAKIWDTLRESGRLKPSTELVNLSATLHRQGLKITDFRTPTNFGTITRESGDEYVVVDLGGVNLLAPGETIDLSKLFVLRSEMRSSAVGRPANFGEGTYEKLEIGVNSKEIVPGISPETRKIQTVSFPLKDIRAFAISDLTFKIVPGSEVGLSRPHAIQLWFEEKWNTLEDVILEDGMPIIFKRGVITSRIPGVNLEGKLGDKTILPPSTSDSRIIIFGALKSGLEQTIYLPRFAYQSRISRGYERTEPRTGYDMNTRSSLAAYYQSGHLEIELMKDYVRFSALGSTYGTNIERRKGAEDSDLFWASQSLMSLAEQGEVPEQRLQVVSDLAARSSVDVMPEQMMRLKNVDVFSLAVIVNQNTYAQTEFAIRNGQLYTRDKPEMELRRLKNNEYIAVAPVPAAGQSQMGLDLSEMFKSYRVRFNPDKNEIEIYNNSPYRMVIEHRVEQSSKALAVPTRNGLTDLEQLLVPAREAIPSGSMLIREIQNYIRENLKGAERTFALRNLIRPDLIPLVTRARWRNILLFFPREIGTDPATVKHLNAIVESLEQIPLPLTWQLKQPLFFAAVKTDTHTLGYQRIDDSLNFGGVAMTQFMARPEELHVVDTVVHELLGHQMPLNSGRRDFTWRDGELIPNPDAWSPLIRRAGWIEIGKKNQLRSLIPLTPSLIQALENQHTIGGLETIKIENLPADAELRDLLRNLFEMPQLYHESILELVAFTTQGENLAKPVPPKGEIPNPKHNFEETRDILLVTNARVDIPVDFKNQVYASYPYDQTTRTFAEVFVQKKVDGQDTVWHTVERSNTGPWKAIGPEIRLRGDARSEMRNYFAARRDEIKTIERISQMGAAAQRERVLRETVVSLMPGVAAKITTRLSDEDIMMLIAQYKAMGGDPQLFESTLRSQIDQIEREAFAEVIRNLDQNTKNNRGSYTVGISIPKNVETSILNHYMEGYIEALKGGEGQVLLDIDHEHRGGIVELLRTARLHFGDLDTGNPNPVLRWGDSQKEISVAQLGDSATTMLPTGYLGLDVSLTAKSLEPYKNDPEMLRLFGRYAGTVQRILAELSQGQGAKLTPAQLKAELRKQLSASEITQEDLIEMTERDGKASFRINLDVIAGIVNTMMARKATESAA